MSSKKRKSVSSAINELVSAAPKTFGGSEDESGDETQAKLVDFDDEIDDFEELSSSFKTPSSIRLKNNKLLEETDARLVFCTC